MVELDIATDDEASPLRPEAPLVEGSNGIPIDVGDRRGGSGDRTTVETVRVQIGDQRQVGDGRGVVALSLDLVEPLGSSGLPAVTRTSA